MADDNIEDGETNELSSLALDSNKQKEFEDKVKRIRAQVSTELFFNNKNSTVCACSMFLQYLLNLSLSLYPSRLK